MVQLCHQLILSLVELLVRFLYEKETKRDIEATRRNERGEIVSDHPFDMQKETMAVMKKGSDGLIEL